MRGIHPASGLAPIVCASGADCEETDHKAARLSWILGRRPSAHDLAHPTRPRFIYFFGVGTRVKIGVSFDPVSRVKNIATQSGTPGDLLAVMPGTEADEKALHERFKSARTLGEWFNQTPSLLALVAQAKQANPDPAKLVRDAKQAHRAALAAWKAEEKNQPDESAAFHQHVARVVAEGRARRANGGAF